MYDSQNDEPEEIMLSNLVISVPEESTDSADTEGKRKLFVGGLSWQTTEEGLKHYFESLGIAIEKVIIMRDKVTGRSRGFGFVTLKQIEDIDKAVNTRLHLGRKIEAKRAIPKRDMDNNSRKLFVGGIPITLSNVEFRQYFETFGAVADAQIMTERQTGHSRGFGFVTFEQDEVARNALKARHIIQGKTVEVKKAQPKKVERQPVHVVHPYPMPFFPAYPSMYAPQAPMYGPILYQQPIPYDPYYLGQQSGVVYAPQYIDTYNSHMIRTPPRATISPSRANSTASVSRKNSADIFSPSLVRPQSRLSSNRRGSSLYVHGTPSSQRISYITPAERTERAWSAGPMSGLGPQLVPPSATSTNTHSQLHTFPTVLSPLSTSQARKRGMSQPVNYRSKSPIVSTQIPVVSLPHGPTSTKQTTRRSTTHQKEEASELHKYFQ